MMLPSDPIWLPAGDDVMEFRHRDEVLAVAYWRDCPDGPGRGWFWFPGLTAFPALSKEPSVRLSERKDDGRKVLDFIERKWRMGGIG